VQYAAVRAGNILRKYEDRFGPLPDFAGVLSLETITRYLAEESLWQVLLLASKTDNVVERAISSGEPAHVAKYAFQLAQSFNNFYHEHSVIAEPGEQRRNLLLWLTVYVRNQLVSTMRVLGIEQPPYM
jgi:arginyl-tRNA synthetase